MARMRDLARHARHEMQQAPRTVRWNPVVLVAYAVLLAAVLVMEFAGLRSGRDAWPTITDIVTRLIRRSALFAGALLGLLVWLPVHFYTGVGPDALVLLVVAGGAIGNVLRGGDAR